MNSDVLGISTAQTNRPVALGKGKGQDAVLFAYPGFLTPAECNTLIALGRKQAAVARYGESVYYASQEATFSMGVSAADEGLTAPERKALAKFEHQVTCITGCGSNGARPARAVFKCTCHREDDVPNPGRFPQGLHVDTHGKVRRFASIILYLNTVLPEGGGETVFPNARDTGCSLLDKGVTHTDMVDEASDGMVAANEMLAAAEAVCASEPSVAGAGRLASARFPVREHKRGVGVCPQQGLALLFFTRHAHSVGHVDPASWHGGARVGQRFEKWILVNFVEVPPAPTAPKAVASTCMPMSAMERRASLMENHLKEQRQIAEAAALLCPVAQPQAWRSPEESGQERGDVECSVAVKRE